MVSFLAWVINRRCRTCGVRLVGEGVRHGLQVFCSPAHQQAHVKARRERQLKRALVSRMLDDVMRNGKGGCC
jgi:hypothetical protein